MNTYDSFLKWMGIDPDGSHKHECPECGAVWEHSNRCVNDEQAHHCPKPGCSGASWRHYEGPKAAVGRLCRALIGI